MAKVKNLREVKERMINSLNNYEKASCEYLKNYKKAKEMGYENAAQTWWDLAQENMEYSCALVLQIMEFGWEVPDYELTSWGKVYGEIK